MKKTKQATTSSAVLSVFASKSLCVCHFVVIFYICLMVLLLSKKTNPNPKSKVNQKLSQQPKLPKVCSSYLM
jgi:hypothetical protein